MLLPDCCGDVRIQYAAVPSQLEGATSCGVLWQAAANRFLLNVPDTACYLVEAGRRITIDPDPATDEAEICRFLRMTPLAVLLLQRGFLALHAAAVAGPDGAVLIAGDSGAGKSALLAALLQRGWQLLADDIGAVALSENGIPMVYPLFPEMVLWRDTREKLRLEPDVSEKRRLLVEEQFSATPQPLKAIYRLAVHKDRPGMERIKGIQLFSLLTTLLYNSRIADVLLERSAYMALSAAITHHVAVHSMKRPRGQWCLDELAAMVAGGGQ